MTTRLSRTATKIARFMLLIDAIPRLRPVLPTGAAANAEALLRACGAVRGRDIDMMRGPSAARMYDRVEGLLGRGQLLWFGVRKRWMAEAVARSVKDGARQVLVVGAGLDPLAVMVARANADVLCIEIDAAATADPKRTGVQGAGLAVANHRVVTADLASGPLGEALRATGWRTDVLSVVVAEGLLMYLRPDAVVEFFAQVRRCTPAGSRVAFSSVFEDERHRPRVMTGHGMLGRFIQATLRVVGEPMHWGLAPDAVPAFLARMGYAVVEQSTPERLREDFLDPVDLHDEPLAPYEHLVLAEVTDAPAP